MSIVYSEPGVFNVVEQWINIGGTYYGLTANDSSHAVAQRNTQVLQGIIELAQAFVGSPPICPTDHPYAATLLFPGHSIVPPPGSGGTERGAQYFFEVLSGESAVASIDCNWPLRFLGTGNVELVMKLDSNNNSGDMFAITNNGNDNAGGFTFEDLRLKYPNIPMESSPPPQWAAIHLTSGGGAQNIRMHRCIFVDCPIGLWAQDGLQISAFDCLVTYSSNVGTGMWLGDTVSNSSAKEVFITDCLFAAGTAPKGSAALEIQSSDQIFVSNCHIDGFTNGIAIKPGPTGGSAVHLHFTSCTIYANADAMGNLGHGCIIQPQPTSAGGVGSAQVAQVSFTSCFFELTAAAEINLTGGGPGILVDATFGAVDTVRFVSCYSTRWPGPGLELTGSASGSNLLPANIEILGGMYAGNNFSPAQSGLNTYGIWVNAAAGVRISGASCVGSYNYIQIGSSGSSPTQSAGIYVGANASEVIIAGCDCRNNSLYGIYVNGGASEVTIEGCDVRSIVSGSNGIVVNGLTTAVTDIFIRDCNARGYSSYSTAINVSGSAVATNPKVQVTNCAGYNDQKATINGNTPPTAAGQNCAAKNGYYGPSIVTFHVGPPGAMGVTATVNSTTFGVPNNSFFSLFLNSPYDTILFANLPSTGNVFTWTGE